jgi:hypothetical protein
MKPITTIILLILCLNIQAQDIGKIKSAMDKLAVLEGEWQGSGWIQQQGPRLEFTQHEKVERKLNGTLLLIEGKGFENDSLAFNAMAMASFDEKANRYRFNSFLYDGKYTQAEGWFDEAGIFHWQFGVPGGGTVRYSITATEHKWLEKGAYQPKDVDQWYPFMQMELTKLK